MKKVLTSLLLIACLALVFQACGNKRGSHKFVGTFENEYGDVFTLKDDMTAIIKIKGGNMGDYKGKWDDGVRHDRPYATIEYNGDPHYYYLRDGFLYFDKKSMEAGRCKVKITYKD